MEKHSLTSRGLSASRLRCTFTKLALASSRATSTSTNRLSLCILVCLVNCLSTTLATTHSSGKAGV
jgi:hypothetical protein